MEKFEKLNRNEMRNVTGGNLKYCTVKCGRDNFVITYYTNDCSADSLAPCTFGGAVLSCICDVQ